VFGAQACKAFEVLCQVTFIRASHAIGATEIGQTMLERLGFKEVVSL
jgi:hypothetical protein